jgi:AraC family transcriptional regulator
VLQAAARQNGYDKIDPHLLPGLTSDPILQALAMSFVPLFDNPERIAVATVDYLAQAIISHFVVVSQRQSINNKPVPGGLAPWQERRAKDFLMARLGGHVELAELAAHCRLSITHFTRSFRKSTGLPPYCWLIERRVDRARNLLLTSGLSLVEIALACGFGDQSHLTRAFKRSVGTSPGAWRRARTRPGDQATI